MFNLISILVLCLLLVDKTLTAIPKDLNWILLHFSDSFDQLEIGENLTVNASIVLNQTNLVDHDLLSKNTCNSPDWMFPLKWKVPSPLMANSEYSRVWIDSWCEILEPSFPTIRFWASLRLVEVGLGHEGNYLVYVIGFPEKKFEVTINQPPDGFDCHYGDQCPNGICDRDTSGRGKCESCQKEEIFDSDNQKCIARKSLNESCTSSRQCQFFKNELQLEMMHILTTQPICVRNACGCKSGLVADQISTPATHKPFVCLTPITSVASNDSCLSNAQCQATGSACGFDLNDLDTKGMRCRCREGFAPLHDNLNCAPYQKCSRQDYNIFEETSKDDPCGEYQFCRESICLCRARFRFDAFGVCRVYQESVRSSFWARNFLYIVGFGVGIFVSLCILGAFRVGKSCIWYKSKIPTTEGRRSEVDSYL